MSNHRYSKFWWQDWQGDKALRCCSLAARGFWMELLCIAHEGSPYGHVTVNGRSASNKQLAGLVGCIEKEVTRLLAELEDAGVFSRTRDGVIFSRRMVKDHESAETFREIGKRGGNPALKPHPNGPGKEEGLRVEPKNPTKGITPMVKSGSYPQYSDSEASKEGRKQEERYLKSYTSGVPYPAGSREDQHVSCAVGERRASMVVHLAASRMQSSAMQPLAQPPRRDIHDQIGKAGPRSNVRPAYLTRDQISASFRRGSVSP